jgi:hypothetical protein
MSTKVVLAKFWPFVHSLPLDPPPAPATKSPTLRKLSRAPRKRERTSSLTGIARMASCRACHCSKF